jgi:hypothetical protein
MAKSLWVKGRMTAKSSYQRTKNDRVFTLTLKSGRVISFESWQAAKKAGWVKLVKEEIKKF